MELLSAVERLARIAYGNGEFGTGADFGERFLIGDAPSLIQKRKTC